MYMPRLSQKGKLMTALVIAGLMSMDTVELEVSLSPQSLDASPSALCAS